MTPSEEDSLFEAPVTRAALEQCVPLPTARSVWVVQKGEFPAGFHKLFEFLKELWRKCAPDDSQSVRGVDVDLKRVIRYLSATDSRPAKRP